MDQNLLSSLINVMESALEEFLVNADDHDHRELSVRRGGVGGETQEEAKADLTIDTLDAIFMFSLVWSVGAVTDAAGRVRIDEFLRKFIEGNCVKDLYPVVNTQLLLRNWEPPLFPDEAPWGKMKIGVPKNDTVYDSAFSAVKGKWVGWHDTVVATAIPANAGFSDIVVPSSTTASLEFLLDLLLTHQKPVLVVGPTGTGKSIFVKQVLSSVLPQEVYKTIGVNFSAKTTANQTQSIIDGKLKKRRKGVFGPGPGEKAVIFVDDMNMPEKSAIHYGAQPPIEILRQLQGSGGWYDLDDMSFKRVEDVQIVGAMGVPGKGAGTHITPRFIRFFNIIGVNDFDETTMTRIFSGICDWYCEHSSVASDVKQVYKLVVQASLDVYSAAAQQLRPTPLKSHYTFNLRDLSKTIQGMVMVKPYDGFNGKACARLWMHESLHVFADRLVSAEDQAIFLEIAKDVIKRGFSMSFEDLFSTLSPSTESKNKPQVGVKEMRGLLFGDYGVAGVPVDKKRWVGVV